MSWFRKKKKVSKSISQLYKDSRDFSKKQEFWDSHNDESYYDPTYDFRIMKKPVKKKRKLWGKKKRKKEDEYEKGRDRVKKIINR